MEVLNQIRMCMIGTGYVGLVSGTCFSALGHHVTCIDNEANKIAMLKEGQIPIYEPELKELVQDNVAKSNLQFTTDKASIKTCDVIFIAVGTPPCSESGRADLKYIEKVVTELASLLTSYKVIVIKSTVPVGTCRKMANLIRELSPKAQFDIVSNPEFLREGSAVFDFMNPDRIIIGTESVQAKTIMNKVYKPFVDRHIPLVYSDIETSEMIKYTANCFLATKIAFVNEIALLCEKLGANVENVMKGVGLDSRIGSQYLQTGPGFGGSCFPKDTLALTQVAEEVGLPLKIVESVIASNIQHKERMVEKIVNACGGSVQGKKIAILGLAFKANTDDIRDSAAITIIQGLKNRGAKIVAYDPAAMEKAADILTDIIFAEALDEALLDAEAVVIVTEWKIFAELSLSKLSKMMSKKNIPATIVDLRNLYDASMMEKAGIRYVPLGKPMLMEQTTAQKTFHETTLLTE